LAIADNTSSAESSGIRALNATPDDSAWLQGGLVSLQEHDRYCGAVGG
jgi:hypothetical protein